MIYTFEKKIKELANDYDNGSAIIAQKGLRIFTEAIESKILRQAKYDNLFCETSKGDKRNKNTEIINLYGEIENIKNKIIETKPAMSMLKNVIEEAYILFIKSKNPKDILEQIEQKLTSASGICLDRAIQCIFEMSVNTIATCSYSSNVINLFQTLHEVNYQFNVIVMESVWKEKDYARKFTEVCKQKGINSNWVNKSYLMKSNIDCGIIGADSVIHEKGIVNGIPSRAFAEILTTMEKPLFVIAESFKAADEVHIEDGFEFIKKSFIEKIFSDDLFLH
ncbi:MAG: hypothetical protein V1779_16535 [bacterium]